MRAIDGSLRRASPSNAPMLAKRSCCENSNMSAPDEHFGGTQPDETDEERINRNLNELLGELRFAIPGVQVLFAFLLAVPFSQRFGGVGPFERNVYLVTLLLTAIASALLI